MSAIAYYILQQLIIATQGRESILKRAIGTDWKGKLSPILYLTGILLALWARWVSLTLYVIVALIWLIPDSRIEKVLAAVDARTA